VFNKRFLLILLLLVVAGGAAAAWLLRAQPVKVTVTSVERGTVVASVSNTRAGTVDACRRAGISPTMGGQLAKLPVREGDAVVAQQILLELWNVDLQAQLLLARRDAVAARARADEACVRAEVAARDAERLESLRGRGLSSEEETDRARGNAKATAAACKAGREAARVSDAQVEVAQANLERTILRAPFDGVIAKINGELGEFVTPSPVGIQTPPTVDLIDDSCLYISAPIDEVDAPAVRAGQTATVTMDAFPGQKFPGVVRRVAPYVLDQEKQARTVEIEAEIRERGDANLLPGYSADVEVLLATRENVLRVPSQALIEGQRALVLLDNGFLEERQIKRGMANWEFVEVLDGLKEGELVVLSVDRAGVVAGAAAVRE
jgi:HlyD family secretion protein